MRNRMWRGWVAVMALGCVGAACAEVAVDLTGAVEKVAGEFKFTEGPVWIGARGELLFSDIPANRIVRFDGTAAATFREPSNHSNGLTLDKQGRLIACEHGTRRVSRTEADGRVVTLADRFEGRRLNSPNDVVVRSDGAMYFTDPPYGVKAEDRELDFQGVYRLSPDGAILTPVVRDFAKPNGLAFSPDESRLYVADTERGHIRVFDVAPDGGLSGGRVFAETPNADGMKVDTMGNVFCTAKPGVMVFDPAGRLIGTIVTSERPANCAFGDRDWRTLFITARTGVYRIRLNVPGIRVP